MIPFCKLFFFFLVGLCKLIHKWKNRCLRYEDDALGFIKNIQPSVSLSCTFFRIAAAYGLFPALFLLLQLLSFHSSPRLRLSQTLMLLSLFCNYPHCFLWWCGRENPVGQGRRPPRIAQQRPSRFRNSRPPQGFLASLLGRIRSVFPVLLIFFFLSCSLFIWFGPFCFSLKDCQLTVRQSNPRQYVADIPQVFDLLRFLFFFFVFLKLHLEM